MAKTPAYIAAHARRILRDGGSAPHSEEVQRFFKEEVQSRGWYTAELRKVAVRVRRAVLREKDLPFLVGVADLLFRGKVLEENGFAVALLEKSVAEFGEREFKLFESWLARVTNWADHDGVVYYLIGPMILQDRARVRRMYSWAKSPNRWHRRAAAVALIRAVRQHKLLGDVEEITECLLADEDDMVQKGLGWLLRETAKANRAWAVRFLLTIRERAPRLVLRTACETLPAADRIKILGKARAAASAR